MVGITITGPDSRALFLPLYSRVFSVEEERSHFFPFVLSLLFDLVIFPLAEEGIRRREVRSVRSLHSRVSEEQPNAREWCGV